MNKHSRDNTYGLRIALILISACTMVSLGALSVLYHHRVTDVGHALRMTVKSHAAFINLLATTDSDPSETSLSTRHQGEQRKRMLSDLATVQEKFQGYGDSGTLSMAEIIGDSIVYTYPRLNKSGGKISVSRKTGLAEPMQRALLGQSGVLIGTDYRGVEVIAAYEPVRSLGMGLVSKVDLSEIRSLYLSSFWLILGFSTITALLGVLLLLRTRQPLVAKLQSNDQELQAAVDLNTQLRKELENSRQMYRDIVETTNDVIIALDNEGRLTYASPGLIHTLGFEPEEIIGKLLTDIAVIEDLPRVRQAIATALDNHDITTEFQAKMMTGTSRWVRVSLVPVLIGNHMMGLRGVMFDVSERKHAEAELRASQSMLQTVINQLPGSIFWKDRNSVYLGCNTAFAVALGRSTAEEVIGKSDHELLTDKTVADFFREIDCRIIDSAQPEYHVIERGLQPDVPELWLDISRVPLQNESGEVVGLLALYFDVTDRVASERALAESESRYRTLFENAGDYVILFELDSTEMPVIIDVNQAAQKVCGYTRDEMLGQPITMIDPDVAPRSAAKGNPLMASESGTTMQVNRRRKDGTLFIAETTCTLVRIGDKDVVLAVERDITKRKQTLDRLSRLNQTVLSFCADPEENINRVTTLAGELLNATCALYNTLDNEMLCTVGQWNAPPDLKTVDNPDGHICYDVIRHPEDETYLVRDLKHSRYWDSDPNVKQYGLESYMGKAISIAGKRIGSLCVVFQRDFVPTDEDREILGLLAAAVRSEEGRRRQNRALRESQERYQLAVRGTRAAIWDWSIQTGKTVFDERWAEIAGYKLDELSPVSIQTWIDLCHPDDLARSRGLLEQHFRGDIPQYECEVRMRHKDGQWVWVLDSGQVTERDSDGRPLRMIGTHVDITRRKYAEDALRESEEQFRGIAEQLNDLIFLTDLSGVITYISPTSKRLFGLLPEEMIGRPFTDFLAQHEIERARTAFERSMRQVTVVAGMLLTMRRGDGSFFEGELDSSHVIHEGKIAGALGVTRDVSERVRAETALRNSERLLSESQSAAGIGSYEFDLVKNRWTNSAAMDKVLGIDENFERGTVGWISLIHPDYRQQMSDYLRRDVLENHERFDREYKIVRPTDGKVRWVHGLGILEYDADGHPVRMLGTIQDITDRKYAEEALHYRETEYRHLIENSGEGIGIVNSQEVFTFANSVAEDIFGVAHGELVGKCIIDFLSEPEQSRIMRESTRRSGGVNGTYELDITRPDGSTRSLLVTATPKLDAAGIFSGSFGIFRDMTDLKRAAAEKQKLESQLRQAQKLETIGTLAGGVAHDFNNILTPILGYADMTLMQIPRDHPTRGNIESIANAALRAKDLVKQILTFSRQSEQERRPMLVQLVVKEAMKLLRASIPSTIDILEEIDNQAPAVDCDPTQIHQVLMNLCTNAFHSMRDTGGVLRITLESCSIDEESSVITINLNPGRYVKLSIEDTGFGMEQATIDRIYEPFFTTKSPGEGTGLGLSVVHGIIKSHGGAISVQSMIGQGTTFCVYLPCAEVIPEMKMNQCAVSLCGTGRILLVDDEPDIVNMTQQMLEQMGYIVTARTSSVEALGAFRNDPAKFDVIITDQTMPQMTGMELGREILQLRPDMPMILMTGFSETITQKNHKQYGFRELVMKPLLARELNVALQRCLTISALEQ